MVNNRNYNIAPSLKIFNRANKDNVLVKDDDLYHQNLRNIVMTNTKERLFNYKFGGDLIRYLFNLFPEINISGLQQRLTELITKYEPRIQLRGVQVSSDKVNHLVKVKIYYSRITEEKDKIYAKDITYDVSEQYTR